MKKSNSYALITGASSGIGWAISMELAAKGYSIVAVSNQPQQLNDLKIAVEEKYKVHVELMDCDLSKSDAAERIFSHCQEQNLKVEVLVNNAGMLIFGDVLSVEIPKVETILQLHLNTPALLCRLFGAEMKDQKKGYILNVSSISAVMPYPTISLYGPTKSFLRNFSRALRTELLGTGVVVSCLLPGATATPLYDDKKVNMALAMRLGVMKKPEAVAKAGLKALFKQRAECVPGILNKLAMLLIPFVPHFLIGVIYRKFYLKEEKKK